MLPCNVATASLQIFPSFSFGLGAIRPNLRHLHGVKESSRVLWVVLELVPSRVKNINTLYAARRYG